MLVHHGNGALTLVVNAVRLSWNLSHCCAEKPKSTDTLGMGKNRNSHVTIISLIIVHFD